MIWQTLTYALCICPPSLCTNISIHHHTASKHTQSARVACLLLLHSLLLTYIITIVPWMYKTSACACRHLSSTHLSKVYWNFRHSRRVYHVYCSLLCICPVGSVSIIHSSWYLIFKYEQYIISPSRYHYICMLIWIWDPIRYVQSYFRGRSVYHNLWTCCY